MFNNFSRFCLPVTIGQVSDVLLDNPLHFLNSLLKEGYLLYLYATQNFKMYANISITYLQSLFDLFEAFLSIAFPQRLNFSLRKKNCYFRGNCNQLTKLQNFTRAEGVNITNNHQTYFIKQRVTCNLRGQKTRKAVLMTIDYMHLL